MKKSIFVSLLALSVAAYSCNKDKNNSQTTQGKLMGKWALTSARWNEYKGGQNHYDSSDYAVGLYYMEFKNNGTVIISSLYTSTQDTSSYKLFDSQKLVIDGTDTFSVNKLTDSDLVLYFRKSRDAQGEYSEGWDNYKKQ
jgi:hypothetical protein